MSLFTIAWMGTTPIDGLIAGAIIDEWSARVALGVGATAALLSGLIAFAVSRRRSFEAAERAAYAAADAADEAAAFNVG